jgi:hypothetical protein
MTTYLLDLQATLVANMEDMRAWAAKRTRGGPSDYHAHIRHVERYRQWLVELLRAEQLHRGARVVLITARKAFYTKTTMASIQTKTAWHPDAAFFNPGDLEPHVAKLELMQARIFPTFSTDPSSYVALESNHRTRAMYAELGIYAERIDEELAELPRRPAGWTATQPRPRRSAQLSLF